ncbi:MAG: vanadium-dependent haloperoxidase [Solirubrobacteraceae bacterium]
MRTPKNAVAWLLALPAVLLAGLSAAGLASAHWQAAPGPRKAAERHYQGPYDQQGSHHGDRQPADTQQTALVLQWYDITNQTVTAAAWPEPATGSRAWSVSWLAAARAVGDSQNPGYDAAALAQALHDALAAQVPSQQSQLDADLASTLAGIPDGAAKSAGIAAGRRQAAAELAQRQGDGLDTASLDIPFTPPPAAPGVWQPTPPTFAPAVRAGQGKAKPFLLASADQFDPGPPPSLKSQTYLRGLAEVRSVGESNSSTRTPQQTDVAAFWEPAANIQYIQLVRGLLAQQQAARSLGWDARFVAVFQVITTDAQIAIYNAKFRYLFWRPVTAIQTGSVNQDPSWTPYFTTPRYPDWPSGHGGYAGSSEGVLDAFVGRGVSSPIAVTSPTDPGSTHYYGDWRALTGEVVDARVWEGIHFRFSDQAGAVLGYRVAAYDLKHLGSLGL